MAKPQDSFSVRYIGRNIWQISGGQGCDSYLLPGRDEAVMIDAGQHRADIRAFAQTLTDKPVRRVINTHGHFDHTGGNGYFDLIYGTVGIAAGAKNTMGEMPELYPLDYQFTLIRDGDIIDPGDRPLRIVELSCHSPGDIAILDMRERSLFCGDEIDSGQVLLLPGYAEKTGQIHSSPAATVETCFGVMEKLKGIAGEFDLLFPGHNGSPLDPVYLDWFSRLCNGIMEGTIRGTADCTSPTYTPQMTHYPRPDAGYLRARYQGASLVYQGELIRNGDYPKAELPPATALHLISAYSLWQAE